MFIVRPETKNLSKSSLRAFCCLTIAAVMAMVLVWSNHSVHAVGTLDSAFGTAGIVTTDFNSGPDAIHAMALQTNGKIVVAGQTYASETTSFDFAVARYNTDGTLDTSFGGTGKVVLDFAGLVDIANALVIQSDGKIVVGGYARTTGNSSALALARFDSSGNLDTGFGTGGKVVTQITANFDQVHGLALQADGKIVATGGANNVNFNSNLALVRYNTNGTVDTGFGGPSAGIIVIDFNGGFDEGNAVTVTAAGKIIVVGQSSSAPSATDTSTALLQFNSDGTADTSFGTAGRRFDRVGANDLGTAVALQPDGKIIVGGTTASDQLTGFDFVVYRHNADGSLDTSFNVSGYSVTNINNNSSDELRAVAIQSDGKIVAVGRSNRDVGIVRYSSGGTVDGKAILDPFGLDDDGAAVAIQPDGKVIAAGTFTNGAAVDFGLARFVSFNNVVPRLVPGDFDGDGKTDAAVYRPSNGVWYLLRSSNGAFVFEAMTANLRPVPADYDGDGKADFATFSISTGGWVIRNSSNGTTTNYNTGVNSDIPVPGDYNGNGKAEVTVFRPSTTIWTGFAEAPATGINRQRQFGISTDLTAQADYDGDGQTDIAVFRPSTGIWYILRSSNVTIAAVSWGVNTDRPVPGDYDGDGRADIAVWRPSQGIWYVVRSSDGAILQQPWGNNSLGDIPVPGDYDGDGKYDFAVYRTGTWYWLNSSSNSLGSVQFGLSGDVPAPATYIP